MPKLDSKTKCPNCGEKLDAATSIEEEGAVPNPGDISICLYCSTVSKFDENLKLKILADEEFASFSTELKNSINMTKNMISRRRDIK